MGPKHFSAFATEKDHMLRSARNANRGPLTVRSACRERRRAYAPMARCNRRIEISSCSMTPVLVRCSKVYPIAPCLSTPMR